MGVAAAAPDATRLSRLHDWLEAGHNAEMDWMEPNPARRAGPETLWPEAKSVIMLGVNYASAENPLEALEHPSKAALALYALRRDYHDVIKGRLKAFAAALIAKAGGEVKVFVDTAPVMEKPLAMAAGLGWQGKHSVLVSRGHGNWLLLGAVYTSLALEPDEAARDHCGSCSRCLDICPTKAFPAPYTLDATLCIAYLTIEHKGAIPRHLRAKFGNRVFGCDDCLAICPWNRFAKATQDAKLALKTDLMGLDLAYLAGLDDAAFRRVFAQTPVKRTGRARFLRNILIAIGNSGDRGLINPAKALLEDESPLVRAMAVWALHRLMPEPDFTALAALRAPDEDAEVEEEWAVAMEYFAIEHAPGPDPGACFRWNCSIGAL